MWTLDRIDLNVLIRFAGAGAELEAVTDFAFDFGQGFVAGEGFDFDMADIAAVVSGEPAGGEAGEGAGEAHDVAGRRTERAYYLNAGAAEKLFVDGVEELLNFGVEQGIHVHAIQGRRIDVERDQVGAVGLEVRDLMHVGVLAGAGVAGGKLPGASGKEHAV